MRRATLSVGSSEPPHKSAQVRASSETAHDEHARRQPNIDWIREPLNLLTFDRLSAALLFVALGTAACFMPAQSDTWWHLRTGQEIWQTGSIQLRDSFSHTVNGGYWPNHEWLSQVLFFGLYRIGGMPLFTGAAALLVLATWWIVWRLMGGHSTRRLVLVSLAVIPSAMAWSLRPQLFTLLLIPSTTWLVVRRHYWYLPPLFLVWVNLHGGVVLGIALLAGSIAAAIVQERRVPGMLVASSGLCILATALSPLKWSLWSEVPASLTRLRQYQVVEWRAPRVGEVALLPFWLMAVALVALASLILMRQLRVRRQPTAAVTDGSSSDLSRNPVGPTAVIGALVLLPFALASSRNVPPFLLLAAPALAFLIESQVPPRRFRMDRHERPMLNFCVLIAAVCASTTIVWGAWTSSSPRLQWQPLPDQVVAAIRACPEPLYNSYDDGGYVIWFVPERKVFLDSRQDPFPASLIQAHIQAELSGDYRALFSRYHIGCALTRTGTPLAYHLLSDGWQNRYTDPTWQVFSR